MIAPPRLRLKQRRRDGKGAQAHARDAEKLPPSMCAVSFAAIILLTACSKEAAVNRGLLDAGVASPAASCMAREMSERLSVEQLRKLDSVADGSGKALADMSVSDYVAAAKRVGDAEVVFLTVAAAAFCDAM